MPSNLDRYKKDLELLVSKGGDLFNAMQAECFPKAFEEQLEDLGDKGKEYLKKLPSFKQTYQGWYSEVKALVKQLLPDRLADFVRHYEAPKRKEVTYENYRIEDYLQGLSVTRGYERQKLLVRTPRSRKCYGNWPY